MRRLRATGRSPLQRFMFTVMPGSVVPVSSCRPRRESGSRPSMHVTGHKDDDQSRAEVLS